jgi:hypothetical protein
VDPPFRREAARIQRLAVPVPGRRAMQVPSWHNRCTHALSWHNRCAAR